MNVLRNRALVFGGATILVIGAVVGVQSAVSASSSSVALHSGDTVTVTCDASQGLSWTGNGAQRVVSCKGRAPTSSSPAPSTTIPPSSSGSLSSSPPPDSSSAQSSSSSPPPGGYPTAATTGVPAGTTLTSMGGDFITSSNGQVINGMSINGDLEVNNSNVQVTNTRIKGRILYRSTGLKLTDTDIGPDACPAAAGDYQLISGSDFTMLRVHLHSNNEDLVRLTGGGGTDTITDSLLDGTCWYNGSHLDDAQFYNPNAVAHVLFDHDSLDSRPVNGSGGFGNATIFWADNPAPASTLTVQDSLLAGGNYTLSLYDAGTIKILNNVIVKGSWQYGACNSNIPVTMAGNTISDGTPLTSC